MGRISFVMPENLRAKQPAKPFLNKTLTNFQVAVEKRDTCFKFYACRKMLRPVKGKKLAQTIYEIAFELLYSTILLQFINLSVMHETIC